MYRSEILFINGIHPEISGKDLTKTEADEIWDTAVVLLRKGKNWNKIITVTPDDHGGRVTKKTLRRNALYAYKRSGFPCRRCATPIVQSTLAARSIWFCPFVRKDQMPDYEALLLFSFGGPESKEDVIPFLKNVTAGKDVPLERLRKLHPNMTFLMVLALSTSRIGILLLPLKKS